MLWLSLLMMQSLRQRRLARIDVTRIRPRLVGLPYLETFAWETLSPAERLIRPGRQDDPPGRVTHLPCKHDQIKINRLRSSFTAQRLHFISPHAPKTLLNMFYQLSPVRQKMDSVIHQIAITQLVSKKSWLH